VGKRKKRSVQGLAAKLGRDAAQLRVADRLPVQWITEDWMPVLCEVDADLMRAPRLKMAANQSTSVQKLDCF
jgi:hypothetical protein